MTMRKLVPAKSQDHTSKLISSIEEPGSVVVVAFPNYPVLDYATSVYDWYNAKVGTREVGVNSGAFVNVLLNLELAEKKTTSAGKAEIVMRPEHQDAQITLTMIRRSDATNCKFDNEFGKDHSDLDFTEVRTLFEQTVAVKLLNIADVSFDLDETEMARLVEK